MAHKSSTSGFTIVELLIVIVVIGIIAALVLNTFAGSQAKARDAKRAADMHSIRTLILSYDATEGELPRSQIYGEDNVGGYDTSAVGGWLTFLNSVTTSTIPKDPLNNETGNPVLDGAKYTYFYYCYHPAWDLYAPNPDEDVARVGYRSEATNQLVFTDVIVTSCLGT